jgi:hypothetical protein
MQIGNYTMSPRVNETTPFSTGERYIATCDCVMYYPDGGGAVRIENPLGEFWGDTPDEARDALAVAFRRWVEEQDQAR